VSTFLTMPPTRTPRTDGTGHLIQERETDRDIWARLDVVSRRYKLIWGFWLLVLPMVGWVARNYLEPLRSIPSLQVQVEDIKANVDTVIVPRLDQADQDRKDMAQMLKVFGKILCAQTSASDRYKYDINCRTDIPAPDPPPPPVPRGY
jgi:hypothetical protein